MKAEIQVNKEKVISEIDNRLYGSFIEHLGRAVYHGIYEPNHETADDMGFRQDVLDTVREMEVPLVRYPGGNFVSGYHWEDGTGDRAKRPKRMELAWSSVETNEVGIDEFQEWAKRVGTDIMMAVNLGTRGPEEAGNVVEYCNSRTDTHFANMRRENGFEEPFGIRTWCLGNEMDGPWQIGHKTPKEYARTACEAAKIMKWTDETIELVACGSSHQNMETFGEWEETVLREAYEHIDYLSMHEYYGNPDNDTPGYLGCSIDMDNFITKVATICDKIKKEKGSDKDIYLSFDEWNVWFHSQEQDKKVPRWQIAPPLLEDIYNMEDALVVGCLLNTLINHADRVKIACLAQLVNVIAPIMTVNGGKMWLQTIFYPYMYACRYGRGKAMKTEVACDTYSAGGKEAIPYVDCSVVWNEEKDGVTIFVVNRNLKDAVETSFSLAGFEDYKMIEHKVLDHEDMKAVNSPEKPDTVVPREGVGMENGTVTLEPHSYHMIRLKK
ncbi:MAG: alpha-N-arabinofuranosidase [Lachnospiraceae bacterium]|nr:alpha-N-arabinofuranosidase [Lachnospiraceae bacterium]